MHKISHPTFIFDDFTLDLACCCLLRRGEEVKLRLKPFEVLRYLVENRGRLVGKEELIKEIWPDSFVTDDSLVQCLVEVRRALGDDSQHYIKTVPRRGYIFKAQVVVDNRASGGRGEGESEGLVEGGPNAHVSMVFGSPALPLPSSPARLLSRSFVLPLTVVVAAAIMIAIALYIFLPWGSAPLERKSIAVLPFRNMSDNKTNEYFSDGVTDDIINQLSKIADLKVISRTSVMRYKSSDKNLRDIAKELGVATVLEGSVRREGNQVRISSQLIDAQTDEHIWGEVYDREIKDIFEIQSDVARRVATALKATFSPAERARLGKRPTENPTAYDYYLRGRELYHLLNKSDNEAAIEFFKKALELDSNYALAYAGMSDAYTQRAMRFGFQAAWSDTAIEVARKAIAIDPTLAEGYKALGFAEMQKGWYRKALQEFGKAIELSPNHEPTLFNIGLTNLILGQYDKALPWMKKSLVLEPTGVRNHTSDVGLVYSFLADDAKAEQWFKRASEVQRDLDEAHLHFSWLYLSRGDFRGALEESQKVLPFSANYTDALHAAGTGELLSGDLSQARQAYEKLVAIDPTGRGWIPPVNHLTSLGYVLAKVGQRKEALEMFNQSLKLDQGDLEQGNESFVIRYDVAAIHAIQDRKPQAYEWLQKSIDAGFRNYRFALIDPLLENLRKDEQFQKMMAQLKGQVDEMRKRAEAQ